ncbi:hypothetical protein BV20DRAFT_972935 [Pilatotrama ljubarskyi]|nr:hypothetical protein BV20DRAFT_972935 [Pilatotrama ljubarskyi]
MRARKVPGADEGTSCWYHSNDGRADQGTTENEKTAISSKCESTLVGTMTKQGNHAHALQLSPAQATALQGSADTPHGGRARTSGDAMMQKRMSP